MDTSITRAEQEEFRRRMEGEHSRINKRLEILEENTEKLNTLNTSIERLAINMESMLKEQMQQGQRLEALERRDGDNWRSFVKTVGMVVVSAAVGYLLRVIGIGG